MLVETDSAFELEDGVDLLSIYVGGIWSEFKTLIPEAQSTVLTSGFNLIILTTLPETNVNELGEQDLLPDTVLLDVIPGILLAEDVDTVGKKNQLFTLLVNNLVETLFKLGVTVDEDYLNIECIKELTEILDFFFTLSGYEDLIGLGVILESQDIPQKERFITALQTYHGDNFDTNPFEYLIEDVNETTLLALVSDLKRELGEDETVMIPDSVKERIVNNRVLFNGCFVTQHLRNGGGLALSLESLLNFFRVELDTLLDNPTDDNIFQYAMLLIKLHLISDENDSGIKEKCLTRLVNLVEDFFQYSKIENVVNKLVLKNE